MPREGNTSTRGVDWLYTRPVSSSDAPGKPAPAPAPATRRAVELVSARPLSPTVRSLVLRAVDGAPIEYVAGQWVDVLVPTPDGIVKRAYSIASAPGRAGHGAIELAVTHVEGGPASTALHTLPVGSRLDVSGPQGFFTREGAPRDQAAVFVGAGTGLAPLRAMLQTELTEHAGPPLVLLFGCRTEQDILWHDDLREAERACPRLRVEVTLSRAPAAWTGRRGHVQEHVAELVRPVTPAQVYVCGLSKMVQDVRRILKEELGLDRKAIHSERYD